MFIKKTKAACPLYYPYWCSSIIVSAKAFKIDTYKIYIDTYMTYYPRVDIVDHLLTPEKK